MMPTPFEVDRALLQEAAERLAPVRGLRWVIGGACSGKSSVCRTIAPGTGPRLARADLATFLLAQIDDLSHVRASPVVSN